MLLSVTKNPPAKMRGTSITKDLICVFFDLYTNWSEFYINGTVRGFKSIPEFQTMLDGIAEEVEEKDRSGKNLKTIVFINDIDIIKMILQPGGESQSFKKKGGNSYTLEYETDRIIFRNFNVIFNNRSQRVKNIFPGVPVCVGMAELIKSFGLPLKKCRYSLAYISKQIFYKDIKAELWEDTREKRRVMRSMQLYNDMQRGNQAGALSSFQKNDICGKIIQGVQSYDKKSAYPSYFIRDRFFPIGKIVWLYGNRYYKISKMRKLIEAREWFKVCIFSPDKIEALSMFGGEDGEAFTYGIEFWDYWTLIERDVSLLDILKNEKVSFRLYGTEKTGYMPDCFRKKIIELYNEKNRLPKDSPERFMKKTQLDMIYGKGLQKYDFKSDDEVFKKYVLRGENFLTPAMSMHVVAGMRHEILKVAYMLGADVISLDTDGIKTTGDKEETKEFFEALNDFIRAENKEAGFDSDIGTWDYEYTASRFIQFAPKVYAYQDGSGLHTKFAGACERHLKKYLKSFPAGADPLQEWAENGLKCMTCGGWYYIQDVGFLEKVVPFVIESGKENEKDNINM